MANDPMGARGRSVSSGLRLPDEWQSCNLSGELSAALLGMVSNICSLSSIPASQVNMYSDSPPQPPVELAAAFSKVMHSKSRYLFLHVESAVVGWMLREGHVYQTMRVPQGATFLEIDLSPWGKSLKGLSVISKYTNSKKLSQGNNQGADRETDAQRY